MTQLVAFTVFLNALYESLRIFKKMSPRLAPIDHIPLVIPDSLSSLVSELAQPLSNELYEAVKSVSTLPQPLCVLNLMYSNPRYEVVTHIVPDSAESFPGTASQYYQDLHKLNPPMPQEADIHALVKYGQRCPHVIEEVRSLPDSVMTHLSLGQDAKPEDILLKLLSLFKAWEIPVLDALNKGGNLRRIVVSALRTPSGRLVSDWS